MAKINLGVLKNLLATAEEVSKAIEEATEFINAQKDSDELFYDELKTAYLLLERIVNAFNKPLEE